MTTSLFISVVMAVYNGERDLHATLESILQQRDVTFELIVVNDGSTDTSMAILSEFAKKDSRLRVYDQENRGLTRSLIRGCVEAQGEFIARQDVGDISLPGRLAIQGAMLQEHPDAVLVGCNYSLVTSNNEVLRDRQSNLNAMTMVHALHAASSALHGPHHGTVMFRKSTYDAIGGYRDAFYYAQDLDLWTRMVEQGDLVFVPEILCKIQFATDSLSGRFREEQQQLKLLIADASALRRQRLSEESVLDQARLVRPKKRASTLAIKKRAASAAYFIGSCLADRGDPASLNYFRQAIKMNPSHLKAWLKLVKAELRRTADSISRL